MVYLLIGTILMAAIAIYFGVKVHGIAKKQMEKREAEIRESLIILAGVLADLSEDLSKAETKELLNLKKLWDKVNLKSEEGVGQEVIDSIGLYRESMVDIDYVLRNRKGL